MSASIEWLDPLCAWTWRASWQGSVLMGLVLVAQWVLSKRLTAHWRYGLWFLVLARLSLPVSIESAFSIFNYTPAAITVELTEPFGTPRPAGNRLPQSLPDISESSPVTTSAIDVGNRSFGTEDEPPPYDAPRRDSWVSWNWGSLLPLLWLGGISLLLVRVLWTYWRLHRRIHGKAPSNDESLLRILEECKKAIGICRNVRIIESRDVESPALFGMIKPRLLLPEKLTSALNPEELRFIILHELYHVKRHDIAWNWLMTLLQAMHWFNPLIWLAFNRMRSDRELACDANVLARLEEDEASSYGRTIVKLLEMFVDRKAVPGLVGILESGSQMKRRIRMIIGFRELAARSAWFAVAPALLLSIVALTDARTSTDYTGMYEAAAGLRMQQQVVCRVVDAETGHAISGAILKVRNRQLKVNELRTDQSGTATIAIDEPRMVQVHAKGYVPRIEVFGFFFQEVPEQSIFRLEKAQTIGGVVLDPEGQAVSGVDVQISVKSPVEPFWDLGRLRPPPLLRVQTNAEGHWYCHEVPRALEKITIQLDHSQYAPTRFIAGSPWPVPMLPGKTNPITIEELQSTTASLVIQKGFRVTGMVMDTEGNPIEGARVTQHFRTSVARESTVDSEGNGRFEFHNGVPGKIRLTALAKGLAPVSKTVDLSPNMAAIRFYLPKGRQLRGRIVDEDGNPIAGASISSNLPGGPWSAETDHGGRFLWEVAPDGSTSLSISAAGYKRSQALSFETGNKEHTIKLMKIKTILVTGRVSDSVTGQPIPEFDVSLSLKPPAMAIYNRPVVVGKNGRFSLKLDDSFAMPRSVTVVEGSSRGSAVKKYVWLKIDARGYMADDSRSVAIEDGDVDLEFALAKAAPWTGTVTMPNLQPVSDAMVYILARPFALMESTGWIHTFDDSPKGRTDALGNFSLDPIPDPRAVLAIHKEEGIGLSAIEGQGSHVSITLQPWGRVEGVLRIGKVVGAHKMVALYRFIPEGISSLLQFNFRAQTDSDGHFAFERVPPGEHRLLRMHQLGDARREGLSVTVTVRPGETVLAELGGTGRPIVGRVVLADWPQRVLWNNYEHSLVRDLPPKHMGTTRNLSSDSNETQLSEESKDRLRNELSYVVEFNDDGSFRIDDVVPGTYLLKIETPELITVSRRVVVPEILGRFMNEPLDLGSITIQ